MDSTHQNHPGEPSSSTASTETKVLRSSARVKAAKEKERERERTTIEQPQSSTSTASKRAREPTTTKGKGKEVAVDSRATKRCAHAFVVRSTGGVSDCSIFQEHAAQRIPQHPHRQLVSPSETPKARSAPNQTRTRKRRPPLPFQHQSSVPGPTPAIPSDHARKPQPQPQICRRRQGQAIHSLGPVQRLMICRSTSGKGKVTSKSKVMSNTLPSTSRADDEDVEMLDATDYMQEDVPEVPEKQGDEGEDKDMDEDDHGDGGDNEHDEDDEGDEGGGERGFGGMDDSAPLSMFGDFRHLGSYMLGLSSRLKTMLNNIKRTADPTTRLLTLQELSELLSISTEDTLAGSFQVESFVRELVRILGGSGNDPDGDDDDDHEHDEDAALAAALALSTGGAYQGDENLEAQVLACRCLANLMEALPGVAHTVVYHGAIPVLCSKLIEISYIDLAEQTLSVSLVRYLRFGAVVYVAFRPWRRFQKNSPVLSFVKAV